MPPDGSTQALGRGSRVFGPSAAVTALDARARVAMSCWAPPAFRGHIGADTPYTSAADTGNRRQSAPGRTDVSTQALKVSGLR
ncbi:hypothetical protein [uncultured Arthrobacter sp.]|uniref:hypothetical protein n=1 Tax=uncultured Arthrobacter sp. TaxID=114050 RepID=UPI0032180619